MPKKKTMLIGIGLTAVLAFGCLILGLWFFDASHTGTAYFYHVGIDTLGAFVCLVLFCGCIGQVEQSTRSFSVLVVMASASFAVNELMWLTAGTPQWRALYFACCLLSKWINLARGCDIFNILFYVGCTAEGGDPQRHRRHGEVLLPRTHPRRHSRKAQKAGSV